MLCVCAARLCFVGFQYSGCNDKRIDTVKEEKYNDNNKKNNNNGVEKQLSEANMSKINKLTLYTYR